MKQHYFNTVGAYSDDQSKDCSDGLQNWLHATWRFALLSLLTIFSSALVNLNAQVGDYSFSQSVGTYTPLTGGSVVAFYEGAAGALSMDDVVYNLPDGTIPFGFVFDGQVYTGLNINSNGFITFGATPPTTSTYVPLSSTTAYSGAISPFGRDLQGGWVFAADRTSGSNLLTNASDIGLAQVGDIISGTGIATGTTITAIDGNTITLSANATSTGAAGPVQVGGTWSNIQYQTLGSAPNRTFVVEFNNFKRFGSVLTTSQHMKLNFQIRLNESDNSIDVAYGDCSPGLTTLTTVNQVGLRGANNTFPANVNNRFNTKNVNDNWLDSVDGTTNASGMLFNNVDPANEIPFGLTYRWDPPSCLTAANVLVGDITNTSAEISWVSTGSNQIDYVIEFGLAGFTLGTGTELTGVSSPTTISSLDSSTNYQFYIKTNCGSDGESVWVGPFAFRTLCDPAFITDTTGDTICGQGTATLSAEASEGVVQWFASESSNLPLFEGNSFTTPLITETTSYWAAAVSGASTIDGLGRVAPTSTLNTSPSNWGLVFTATNGFTLNTVDVYITGSAAGTITVNLTDLNGVVLQTTQVATPAGGSTASPLLFTVPLNFEVQPGNYRLMCQSGPAMIRETSGITYPYDLGGFGEITSGYLTSNTLTTYYWFYNWSITAGCVGPKVEVVATVTEADEIFVDSSDDVICLGQSTELTVTSANEDYEYVWEPGGLVGAVHVVSPLETTTYTVTATDAIGGCVTEEIITITVNPLPSTLVITPSATETCIDNVVTLTATGGNFDTTLYQQNMNSLPADFILNNIAGVGSATINSTYFSEGNASLLLTTASTGANVSYELNTNIDLTGASSASIVFSHIAAMESPTFSFDFGIVEYSTDGGANWILIPSSNYVGSANTTVFNDNIRFSTRSYPDWISTFTSATSTPGVGPATSLWKTETINIPAAALNSNQFRIRFRYTTDVSTNYFGWLIDDVKIIKGANNVTWSPVSNLFTDAAATIPYVANSSSATVYYKPTVDGTTQITATSTSLPGCFATQNVSIITNPTPDAPIAEDQSFCSSENATVADLVATGQNLAWYSVETGGTALASNTVLVNGNYYVSQTLNGCEGSRTMITVTIGSVPAPTGDPVQEITGDTAAFISDIVVVGTNIVWYATLQDALNGTNPLDPTTELVDGATYYAVSVDNGCFSDPFAVTVNVTLSIGGIVFNNFNFYPNPVSDMLYISNSEMITSVKVINLLGQEIMHVNVNANQGSVNLSTLPQGGYLMQVQVSEFTKVVKVIKR